MFAIVEITYKNAKNCFILYQFWWYRSRNGNGTQLFYDMFQKAA